MRLVLNYLATLVPLLIIDFIWLIGVARNFYKQQIGHLMTDNVNWFAAVSFYFIYAAAIYYLVVEPAQHQMSFGQVAMRGAVLGFVAYATYDLTNLATLKQWPVLLTVVDLAWGTLLTAVIAVFATWLIKLWQ